MTTTELANLSGFTVQRIGQLVKQRILPKPVDCQFPDENAVLVALFRHCRAMQPSGARQRRELAMAKLAELKLKRERKLVIPVAHVQSLLTDITLMFRQGVLQIPLHIGSQTGSVAAQGIADRIVSDVLRELAKKIEAQADDEAVKGDDDWD